MVTRAGGIMLVALAATACTKTVVLKEDSPVRVTAQPPAEPEPPPKRVEVKKEKIQVNEKIHFEFDSAKIRGESHDLLDEIASVINDHPELVKIRIEGHTDSQGKAEYNLDLSKRRARAVRDYLVNAGHVAADKLETEGYGLDRPIASNETDEGRAKNRRVEFNILERDEEAAAAAGAPGEEAKEAGEGEAVEVEEAAANPEADTEDEEDAAAEGGDSAGGSEVEAAAEKTGGER